MYSKVTFHYPIANISGKVIDKEKVAFRTRNGRTHSYVIQNPYTGLVAPTRQRTIDAFRNAVIQTGIIFKDDAKRAEWQVQYDTYRSDHQHRTDESEKNIQPFVVTSLLN